MVGGGGALRLRAPIGILEITQPQAVYVLQFCGSPEQPKYIFRTRLRAAVALELAWLGDTVPIGPRKLDTTAAQRKFVSRPISGRLFNGMHVVFCFFRIPFAGGADTLSVFSSLDFIYAE